MLLNDWLGLETPMNPEFVRKLIGNGYSRDGVTCYRCHSKLFVAVPGVTTPAQIREFARTSVKYAGTDIERDGWIHPGIYCSRGCVVVLANRKPPNGNDLP